MDTFLRENATNFDSAWKTSGKIFFHNWIYNEFEVQFSLVILLKFEQDQMIKIRKIENIFVNVQSARNWRGKKIVQRILAIRCKEGTLQSVVKEIFSISEKKSVSILPEWGFKTQNDSLSYEISFYKILTISTFNLASEYHCAFPILSRFSISNFHATNIRFLPSNSINYSRRSLFSYNKYISVY